MLLGFLEQGEIPGQSVRKYLKAHVRRHHAESLFAREFFSSQKSCLLASCVRNGCVRNHRLTNVGNSSLYSSKSRSYNARFVSGSWYPGIQSYFSPYHSYGSNSKPKSDAVIAAVWVSQYWWKSVQTNRVIPTLRAGICGSATLRAHSKTIFGTENSFESRILAITIRSDALNIFGIVSVAVACFPGGWQWTILIEQKTYKITFTESMCKISIPNLMIS